MSLRTPASPAELTLAPDVARDVCQQLVLSGEVADRALELASTYGGFGECHARGSPRTIAAACVWLAVREVGIAASVGAPDRDSDRRFTQETIAEAAGTSPTSLRQARNRIENQGGRL